MISSFKKHSLKTWEVLRLSIEKFIDINGLQWSSSFAYNVLLSLFPLILLLITITSSFIDQGVTNQEILTYIQRYIPITKDIQKYIFDTISDVIESRGKMSIMAFFILVWMSLQCFITLVYSINLAWNIKASNWWSMPVKSIILFVIMISIASLLMIVAWFFPIQIWQYKIGILIFQVSLVFVSLSLCYKIAPITGSIQFSHVYPSALFTTGLLWIAAKLFRIYLSNFANFNIIYGTFAVIMIILFWIYLSGAIIIFGACLTSSQQKIKND